MVRDWPAGTVQLPVAMYGLPTLVQLPETLPDTNVEATAWLAKVQNECQAGGGLGNPVSSSGPVGGRISVSGVKPIAVFSFDVIGLFHCLWFPRHLPAFRMNSSRSLREDVVCDLGHVLTTANVSPVRPGSLPRRHGSR